MSIAAIALLAALAGSSQAEVSPGPETRSEIRIVTMGGPDGPGRLDSDGDGVVTREEFSAPLGAAFDRLDADDDGRLTTQELDAGHGGNPDGPGGDRHVMIMRGPGAHGGHGGLPMILHGRDDGDARVFMFQRGGAQDDPAHGGPGERRVEIRRFGGPGGHDGMDADNDGKVSEEEFLAPMRDAFRSMDSDHDGSLAQGEGPSAPPPPPSAD